MMFEKCGMVCDRVHFSGGKDMVWFWDVLDLVRWMVEVRCRTRV